MFCRKFSSTNHAPLHLPKILAAFVSVCVLVNLSIDANGFAPPVSQQTFTREIALSEGGTVSIKNPRGRVTVTASTEQHDKLALRSEQPRARASTSDVRVESAGNAIEIVVAPKQTTNARNMDNDRIDLIIRVPPKTKLRVETNDGAVDVVGEFAFVSVVTRTGTLRADVPVDSLRYEFHWTSSRPRVFSEVKLADAQERRGGRFDIIGTLHKKEDSNTETKSDEPSNADNKNDTQKNTNTKNEPRKSRFPFKFPGLPKRAEDPTMSFIEFTTERGLLLFGVSDPAMVPSDLRERPLTEAARAIIRSGNEDLIEAIARISPRYVKDYAERLPNVRDNAPTLRDTKRGQQLNVNTSTPTTPNVLYLIRFNASVTDPNGRAISGLNIKDFALFENGEPREIKNIEPTNAPFNLVLLLDVSGSVEERLDFIRKSALAFVNTVGAQDRVAIITFRDDIKVISDFTSDRAALTKRINDIDAGGATALYDALAYALIETLRPVHNERTGIVILSDGDDNKSFIPFPSVLEATIESGALIYPLYVPSGLTPEGRAPAPITTLDPTRSRYLTLTSRADEEGRKLAEVSGGVYYAITRFDDLPKAFADIIAHLRTAYSITYASPLNTANINDRRVRVKVNRANADVRLSPAIEIK